MNILFLSELFYPHGGGAEFATYLYAKILSRAKYNVVVVTNRFEGELESSRNEGFTIYRLPLFKQGESSKFSTLSKINFLFSRFMRKWIKWADVVYIPRFWFSSIPFAKAYRKPVITHLHDYIPICPLAALYDSTRNEVCSHCSNHNYCSMRCIYIIERRKRSLTRSIESTLMNIFARPIIRRLIEYSDAIICVSFKQRQILVENLPSISGKASVIHNPLPSLDPANIGQDGFGYFGGPRYLKGFNVLKRALDFLNPVSFLVHATNFPDSHPMTKFAKSLGIVTYERLEEDKISKLYEKIRGVLVPSICAETWSYVVMEAFLRARVVIASRVGGISELVKGCRGVFLFDPGDFRQLAEKIGYVSSLDREVVTDLGMHNREVFLNNFSNEKTLRDFSELCEKLAT